MDTGYTTEEVKRFLETYSEILMRQQ